MYVFKGIVMRLHERITKDNLKANYESAIKTFKGLHERFISIHGDAYDYSKVVYNGRKNKIIVTCKKHGDWLITVNNHLGGKGCKKCSLETRLPMPTKEMVMKFMSVHGNSYDYSKVVYNGPDDNVKIICPIHGQFMQLPYNHLRGCGCPICANMSRAANMHANTYKNKKTILYYIKINEFYKIGLTRTSVEERFKKELSEGISINIIAQYLFNDGAEAFKMEQKLLKETKHNAIHFEQSPITSGWTELRRCEIPINPEEYPISEVHFNLF